MDFFEVGEKDKCWLWTGATTEGGYGVFRISQNNNELAHRFAWELQNGQSAGEFMVCHHCDNPPCVNPNHLFKGTAKDNSHDMLKKGRCNPPRGVRAAISILNDEKVRQIKILIPTKSEKELGKMFGVHYMTIHAIKTGRSWGHVHI